MESMIIVVGRKFRNVSEQCSRGAGIPFTYYMAWNGPTKEDDFASLESALRSKFHCIVEVEQCTKV